MDYINIDRTSDNPSKVLLERGMELIEDVEIPKQGSPIEVRSALRMQYEIEAQIIRKRLGGLRVTADALHINQRQMARILMVDPSAVHRWFKNEDKVPPYIWRLLDYHAALNIGPESDQIRYLKEQIRRIELTLYSLQTSQPSRHSPNQTNLLSKVFQWIWSKIFTRVS